jgi:hypothetical protein
MNPHTIGIYWRNVYFVQSAQEMFLGVKYHHPQATFQQQLKEE